MRCRTQPTGVDVELSPSLPGWTAPNHPDGHPEFCLDLRLESFRSGVWNP